MIEYPTYPHIFLEGPQAMIVSSALDPGNLLDELNRRGFHPKLWTAKLTGTDTGGLGEILHGFNVAHSRGLHIGGWIQCGADPKSDVASVAPWVPHLEYIEFCTEYEYKVNPGLAAQLVAEAQVIKLPKAQISYGKLDTQINNAAFSQAGWATVPECYGPYVLSQAYSYIPTWPGRAIHPMERRIPPDKFLGNMCGVFRPEGLL